MAAGGHFGSPNAPKTIGFFHYVLSMAMPNMKLIGEFMTQLEMPQAFWAFVYKMAAKNQKVLVIWDLNGYGEYEFDWRICDKVMACTSVGVRRRNQKHNTPEIFKFRGYNYIFEKKVHSSTNMVIFCFEVIAYWHGENLQLCKLVQCWICSRVSKTV